MQVRSEVLRSVKVLDRCYPDWWKEVDPSMLDMNDGNRCVLGQLLRQKKISFLRASWCLFSGGFASKDHRELTFEWQSVIITRRREHQTQQSTEAVRVWAGNDEHRAFIGGLMQQPG